MIWTCYLFYVFCLFFLVRYVTLNVIVNAFFFLACLNSLSIHFAFLRLRLRLRLLLRCFLRLFLDLDLDLLLASSSSLYLSINLS
jgi:hypothetical protein